MKIIIFEDQPKNETIIAYPESSKVSLPPRKKKESNSSSTIPNQIPPIPNLLPHPNPNQNPTHLLPNPPPKPHRVSPPPLLLLALALPNTNLHPLEHEIRFLAMEVVRTHAAQRCDEIELFFRAQRGVDVDAAGGDFDAEEIGEAAVVCE